MTQLARFNSKLVRLKAGTAARFFARLCLFQFQTGAIKRVNGAGQATISFVNFNSKLVRLKAAPHQTPSYKPVNRFNSKLVRLKAWVSVASPATCAVSIPNWCD